MKGTKTHLKPPSKWEMPWWYLTLFKIAPGDLSCTLTSLDPERNFALRSLVMRQEILLNDTVHQGKHCDQVEIQVHPTVTLGSGVPERVSFPCLIYDTRHIWHSKSWLIPNDPWPPNKSRLQLECNLPFTVASKYCGKTLWCF